MIKMRFPAKCIQGKGREAHLPRESGPTPDIEEIQAHSRTDHTKSVARWPSPSAATPGVRPPPTTASGVHRRRGGSLILGEVGLDSYYVYLTPNWPVGRINKWESSEAKKTHQTQLNSPHSSSTIVLLLFISSLEQGEGTLEGLTPWRGSWYE